MRGVEPCHAMTELEMCCVLGALFYSNRDAYKDSLKETIQQAHQSIHNTFPKKMRQKLCHYIPSFLEQVAQEQSITLEIIKGVETLQERNQPEPDWKYNPESELWEKVWFHHINFNPETGLYIDIVPEIAHISTQLPPNFRPVKKLTSEQLLGYPLFETYKALLP